RERPPERLAPSRTRSLFHGALTPSGATGVHDESGAGPIVHLPFPPRNQPQGPEADGKPRTASRRNPRKGFPSPGGGSPGRQGGGGRPPVVWAPVELLMTLLRSPPWSRP